MTKIWQVIIVALKSLSFRTDENEIAYIRKVALLLNTSVGKLISEAVREYLGRKEQEIIRRRILERFNAVEEASPEETAEILAEIDSLAEDDRKVVKVDYVTTECESGNGG